MGEGRPPVVSSRRFFFFAKTDFALFGRVRGDHHLGEDLHDPLGGIGVERPVQRDDPPEGGGPVAVEGAGIGLGQGLAAGDAAGIGMLDDRADRAIVGVELRHQLEGRVGVVDVVVAQLLALVLGGGGHAGAGAVGVEGRCWCGFSP
jgi:hypothetical protein